MKSLSVCLLTFNSERLLEECLKPLLQIADELIVVDSGSSDKTLVILAANGVKSTYRKYTTHADQMNYATTLARHNWVLCMDSDEVLDDATVVNIRTLKQNELNDESVAYRISRFWRVLNRPVHAIYPVSSPDYPVRLFHRGRARFNDSPVDDKVMGFDSTRVIAGHVAHDTFYSLHEVFHKLNAYTSRLCQFRKVSPSLARAFLNPWFAFIKWYFFKKSWKDGRVGVVSGVYAFLYTFLKYFKAWYSAGEKRSS
ncbi:MAG: glycosyltransferase family 2 protein [Gammaproteobacteria bacterium]|nr:glycosyltransferase family 2 protein [Gammaproteobacteria bacterium]